MITTEAKTTRRGRPSLKRDRVVKWLRSNMVKGVLAPGAKLPTHARLMHKFNASADTVQAAMDELANDGHVRSLDKAGSFVVDRPAYLHRYAMVFMQTAHRTGYWSYMYRAMETAAATVAARRSIDIVRFDIPQGDPRSPDHARLLADIAAHRLAGILFTMSPFEFVSSPIIKSPGMPRVAITEANVTEPMGVVTRQIKQFPALAVQALARNGRRRAALTCFINDYFSPDAVARELASAGMTTRPHWLFPTEPVGGSVGLKHFIQLLLDRPVDDRPDSLIVADDNLVESAVAGIRAAGLTPGRDVMVVSLGNAPALPPVDADVTWIAFDNTALFESCLDCLDSIRINGVIPPLAIAPLALIAKPRHGMTGERSAND